MSSDSKGRLKGRFLHSFTFAISGIFHAIRNERNMKIHSVVAIIVIILSWIYDVSAIEWMFISFAICGVLALELVNTALERVVDLITKDFHPLAKQAKDVAAGAVLLYAILSVVIGCIIFLPKIF
jgi:undecaprenol kinase